MHECTILATDLDGTLIPFGHSEDNRRDLEILSRELDERDVPLVFVTGRHLDSINRAIELQRLPLPHWIICDVGTRICRRDPDGSIHEVADYRLHLEEKIARLPIEELAERLSRLEGLRRQEPEKQSRFKLSYYCEAQRLDELHSLLQECVAEWQAPYGVVGSIDPYDDDGLIDLLPAGVDKAYGLTWWADHAGLPHGEVVFAGDSGNDLAAFLAGYRCIIVSNAPSELTQIVQQEHERREWRDRLFLANLPATSGVLEGCRHFGLLASSR